MLAVKISLGLIYICSRNGGAYVFKIQAEIRQRSGIRLNADSRFLSGS
jgi:hypothetical protein